MGFIGDIFGGGGDDAADASRDAAEITAGYQQEALDYLKEREQIPQEFREGALKLLGGISGLPGGEGSQQDLIDEVLSSPLYGAIMGGQEFGEEAILRNAAATGGLRSGTVQQNLYDYNIRLQNQALLQSYNQELQNVQRLAGLGSMAPQIAQQTGQIGQTLGMGEVAAGQARETARQQGFGNILGLGAIGAAIYSDRRLKKNIKLIGTENGWNIYSWIWNRVAEKMGMYGKCRGVMADEVYTVFPEAIKVKDLFLMVDYSKLGVCPT